MFGDPGFGGAGDAVEEEGAIGGECCDGDFDDASVTDVFGGDFGAVGEGAAEEVGGDGPGGEVPVGGAGAIVLVGEGGEFVGVLVFGVLAEKGGDGVGGWVAFGFVLGGGHGD